MKKFFAFVIAAALVLSMITVPSMAETRTGANETPARAPQTAIDHRSDVVAADGEAVVILNVPEDIWGDGTGYQLLLDVDATAYGVEIPESGTFDPSTGYGAFEYTIPEDADCSASASNIVIENSVAITIPAGIYDYAFINPDNMGNMWISSNSGNVPGRGDDFEFEANKTYEFTLSMMGTGDGVTLVVTDSGENPPTEPPTTEPPTNPPTDEPVEGLIAGYYFETQEEVDEWTFIGTDDTNWVWSFDNPGGYDYTEFAHEGEGFIMSYSFVDYVGSYQANNWAISPAVTLPNGTASVSFYASNANSSYPETFSVYVGTTPNTADMTLLQTITPTTGYDDEWSFYEIDLTDYAGQTIYLAFYDECYDMYEIWIDQVEFWGEGGEQPPVPTILGDVDFDGDVDIPDALLALRYCMGVMELSDDQLYQADINGDGAVTMDDSIIILRIALGTYVVE